MFCFMLEFGTIHWSQHNCPSETGGGKMMKHLLTMAFPEKMSILSNDMTTHPHLTTTFLEETMPMNLRLLCCFYYIYFEWGICACGKKFKCYQIYMKEKVCLPLSPSLVPQAPSSSQRESPLLSFHLTFFQRLYLTNHYIFYLIEHNLYIKYAWHIYSTL